mmetsp:Transcript_9230/g.24381  ORF Transcript_9230/g.24381 Transcript_9230/m.24381 type:complete len:241 (+) Transcript_9230:263-985(+)
MAVVMNVAFLGDGHKRGAGAAFSVARGAPARHEAVLEQLAYNFVHRAQILQRELRQHVFALCSARVGEILFTLRSFCVCALQLSLELVVCADVSAAARGHLTDAELQQHASHLGTLARAQNHSRVWHRASQHCNKLRKLLIGNRARAASCGIWRAHGRLNARDAHRMRPGAICVFKVLRMLQHGEHLEAVVCESEKRANADVVDSAELRAVHREQAVLVVRFRARRMHSSKRFAVVRFLK